MAERELTLNKTAPLTVLALGGELKSAVCLLSGEKARLSDPVGDLSDPSNFRAFVKTVTHFLDESPVPVERIACDLHPGYAATRHARTLDLPCARVQHHHAHVASCLAENGRAGPVVGLSCDGTGFGSDGAIWGCEVLVCGEDRFFRAAHLDYFPLAGGDVAARETWRPAAGLIFQALGPEGFKESSPLFSGVDATALSLTTQRLAGPGRLPPCSSLGRLFDGVAFLLGLCRENREEAQAPRALEAAASKGSDNIKPLSFSMVRGEGSLRIDYRPLIRALVHRVLKGEAAFDLARAFHEAVAEFLSSAAVEAANRSDIGEVALSGGCFFNAILRQEVVKRVEAAGLHAITHDRISPGDEGLALGQAVIGSLAAL